MKEQHNFLLELLTEELPIKEIRHLINDLKTQIEKRLKLASLNFEAIKSFATPRRLAIIINNLDSSQPDQFIERKGPSLNSAFDAYGNPTKAAIGFAKSCGTDVYNLEKTTSGNESWLTFKTTKPGKTIFELIPEIIDESVHSMHISKGMRWGNVLEIFSRPVHGVIMLYGHTVIPDCIFGIQTSNITHGHRFHNPGNIVIDDPEQYENILLQNHVIADFDKRKAIIRDQLKTISKELNATFNDDDELLNDVTSCTEWPVALLCSFPKEYLSLPKEALSFSMKIHQKCFSLFSLEDNSYNLLPNFITIANLESLDVKQIIKGNERVMNARLSDAKFFYDTDLKTTLAQHTESLKSVIYQEELGSLLDSTMRIMTLASHIGTSIGANASYLEHACLLSKADLMTEMVGEFPELQGIMGYYYAKAENLSEQTAIALKEQYLPRYSGDKLPSSKEGIALAIASRIDTIAGYFEINKIPTGDKDPFGLRRAALGILRIAIEKEIKLDLDELFKIAKQSFSKLISNQRLLESMRDIAGMHMIENLKDFIYERLKTILLEIGYTAQQFASIAKESASNPYDFYKRIQAVKLFSETIDAQNLIQANKRVANILKKNNSLQDDLIVNNKLFEKQIEHDLFKTIQEKEVIVSDLAKKQQYTNLLMELINLKKPVDEFFENIMIMTDNEEIRNNRIAILTRLRNIFLTVADVSLL